MKPRFVRLDERPLPEYHVAASEYVLAVRDLSTTGIYRVLKVEEDCGERFYLLVGGAAWYSANLFVEVP